MSRGSELLFYAFALTHLLDLTLCLLRLKKEVGSFVKPPRKFLSHRQKCLKNTTNYKKIFGIVLYLIVIIYKQPSGILCSQNR